jgi:hypothetical protein
VTRAASLKSIFGRFLFLGAGFVFALFFSHGREIQNKTLINTEKERQHARAGRECERKTDQSVHSKIPFNFQKTTDQIFFTDATVD